MIAVFIFALHIIAIIVLFIKQYKKEGVGTGILTVCFVVLIFSVGWGMSGFLLKFLIQKEGFAVWLDRDTLSLVAVTLGEIILYYIYFKKEKR